MEGQGWPNRSGNPTVEVIFEDMAGNKVAKPLLVDTGNPYEFIIDPENMSRLKWAEAPNVQTNFGLLDGGWIYIHIPELNIKKHVVAYASQLIVDEVKRTRDSIYEGLVGLPFLDEFESWGKIAGKEGFHLGV